MSTTRKWRALNGVAILLSARLRYLAFCEGGLSGVELEGFIGAGVKFGLAGPLGGGAGWFSIGVLFDATFGPELLAVFVFLMPTPNATRITTRTAPAIQASAPPPPRAFKS